MILHLIVESQFTDYVINQFSAPEMHSEVVVIHAENYIKHKFQIDKVRVVAPYSEEFNQLMSSLNNYSAVVLHGLFQPWCETVLRNVPSNVKVAWVFWGGEIYGRKDLRERFLSKRSKWLLRIQKVKQGIKNRKKTECYELPFELYHRIDYCLTDVHEDFEFVKAYSGFDAKELWYNYYSIDETIGDLRDQTVDGNNIIIGNSCTLECNHLDGFNAVKCFYDERSKIFVSLSYGEPWLRNLLFRKGKRLYGDRFHPLVDFMARDEYNRIIKSCAVVIMPHYRPQAFGNILTALWLGSRVYMSEKSPLYAFFKRIGVIIFSVETDLKKSKRTRVNPLSADERDQNRKLIASLYDVDVMRKKNMEIVRTLEKRE